MKQSTFWYQGKKITKAEHDKLSWEEIHVENNKVGGPRPAKRGEGKAKKQ